MREKPYADSRVVHFETDQWSSTWMRTVSLWPCGFVTSTRISPSRSARISTSRRPSFCTSVARTEAPGPGTTTRWSPRPSPKSPTLVGVPATMEVGMTCFTENEGVGRVTWRSTVPSSSMPWKGEVRTPGSVGGLALTSGFELPMDEIQTPTRPRNKTPVPTTNQTPLPPEDSRVGDSAATSTSRLCAGWKRDSLAGTYPKLFAPSRDEVPATERPAAARSLEPTPTETARRRASAFRRYHLASSDSLSSAR